MSTSSQLDSVASQALPKEKSRRYRLKKYRRFNFGFIAAALLPLFGVGLFNITIDPYGVFSSPTRQGLNQSKPRKDNNDRVFKATDIVKIKPVTVILGSSRTKRGINPKHPGLANLQPAYNLALNGPNIYEQLRYLEHAISNQKNLKEVIFGVDFFMFNSYLKNQASFSESRLNKQNITVQDAINFGLSIDSLVASIETIEDSKKTLGQEKFSDNGFTPYRDFKQSDNQWRFKAGINDYLRNHASYNFSDKFLQDFQKIVELCQKKNINLIVFISPTHATDLETIRATGAWDRLEQWKRDLVKITPVWDFSGYTSITTEPISTNMKNYVDNSHYTEEIGNLVLNRILSYQAETVPKDFGVLLTPDNVESHIDQIRADREVWAKNNPEEVKLVQEIKHEYDFKHRSVTK